MLHNVNVCGWYTIAVRPFDSFIEKTFTSHHFFVLEFDKLVYEPPVFGFRLHNYIKTQQEESIKTVTVKRCVYFANYVGSPSFRVYINVFRETKIYPNEVSRDACR